MRHCKPYTLRTICNGDDPVVHLGTLQLTSAELERYRWALDMARHFDPLQDVRKVELTLGEVMMLFSHRDWMEKLIVTWEFQNLVKRHRGTEVVLEEQITRKDPEWHGISTPESRKKTQEFQDGLRVCRERNIR